MAWAPEARARIEAKIAELLRDKTLSGFAREAGVLPLYADVGGAVGLAPDGGFVMRDNTTNETSTPERRWEVAALVRGIARYPELADLLAPMLPVRTADATPCADCDGCGHVVIGEQEIGCGTCAGLGWVGWSDGA